MLTSKITTIEKRIISREKRIYIEFVMLSTARGFKNALKSKLFWRTIWIISLLAAWTFTIYQSTNLIIAYLRYDAVENIKIKTSAKIPFPAVTICNNNPFKYSLIRKLIDVDGIANTSLGSSIDYGNYSTAGLILDDILKGILMSERNDLGYGWGKQKRRLDILRYIALLKAFTYDFMLNYSMLGHSIESMLLTCSYQGDNCFTSNFSSFDHSVYGRCHTIIVDRSYKSLYGTTSGLVITLNVESAEYIPQLWSHLGFQVIIHPHEYVPFPEDTGFGISPGSATQVAIKQQLLTRLPYPYDNEDCGTISQSEINLVPYQNWLQLLMINNLTSQLNYSSLLCGKTCYLGLVYETCGCIDATYVTFAMAVEYFEANDLPNVTQYGVACNTANDNVWECVQNVAESVLDPSSKCIQECPQPCHEVKYQLNIKDNVWPQKSGTEYDAYLSMPQLINITPSDLTQHLVNLNVYFQDLTFETIVETPAMNVFGLLSSIGGTLGLFIGVGALNIVELIQMLFAVFGCTPAEYRPADNHQEATTDHKQNDGQVIHPKLTVDNQRGLWYDNNSAVSNISVINNYGLAVDQLKK